MILGAPINTSEHGGRLSLARRQFPNALQPWLDLSTGVNPRPYPLPVLATEVWSRLPDEDAFAATQKAAERSYHVPSGAQVVAGAGVQSFIQLIPYAFPARRVAVLGFTYTEHAACWHAAGAVVETIETLAQFDDRFDACVVVNPNNPDGRCIEVEQLIACAKRIERSNQLLIIDESFIDFTPRHSAVALSVLVNVIVLRSFGKAYGLPGLRLGFALCHAVKADLLRQMLGPWSVSGPALAIGACALPDREWLNTSAIRCEQEAQRLDQLLMRNGFELIGGTSLFRLVRRPSAHETYLKLCQHGVLVRMFSQQADWIRFGLPGDGDAWRRLTCALEAV
jgi:cobalamin biosynthetic protein CobC